MRNLKKILALVLALVMSLSLITTAGAADFSDANSINDGYQDAIDVLSELKVFQGYSDGSFQPQGQITRAEVAAIIYRIVTADVSDGQKDIYSTWGKFSDVQDGAWFAGYVNYCANAGYIKGRGNNKFDPQANVTGYEALAMILRAVGYDKNSEFTGSNWQVRTASTARERGVLKNVNEGLLGQNASRELVAEILFRSILISEVNFNANKLDYDEKPLNSDGKKQTIGYESFKLEELTGVVLANEKASLDSDSPLADGKVKMAVTENNKTTNYTLNDEKDDATGFNALGESYHAYITDANKTTTKVLKMAKSADSKSWETWDKKELDSDSKFRDASGFADQKSTTWLLNYGASWAKTEEWDSSTDRRIRYELSTGGTIIATDAADGTYNVSSTELAKANTLIEKIGLSSLPKLGTIKAGETELNSKNFNAYYSLRYVETNGTGDKLYKIVYSREFQTGDEVDSTQRANIKWIFNNADRFGKDVSDYVDGEVYVGTSSVTDVSDIMSYAEFEKAYITLEGSKTNNVSLSGLVKANERGNYIKVIDNDNDGYADYVLKNVYTMAQVVKAKDDKYGLDTRNTEAKPQPLCDDPDSPKAQEKANFLTNEDVKCEDGTLALGDIVYYFMADGQGWAYKAESADIKVDTVNRADKKITASDGTEYFESGVHGQHVVSSDYTCGVTNMNGYTTYTVYFDGAPEKNVALFTDSNAGDFTLIVDGWYNQTKTGVEYAVWAYNDETGRQELRDVTRNGSLFIDDGVQWNKGLVLNNDWYALKWLGGTSGNTSLINTVGAANTTLNGNDQNVKTTVATLTADGVLQPVDYSSANSRVVRMIATDGNAIPTPAASYNGKAYNTYGNTDTAYNNLTDNTAEVRALASTVYYIVYPGVSADSGFVVERYVGYSKLPNVDKNNIEDVYAVATRQERTSGLGGIPYYTANVVVIEMKAPTGFRDTALLYNFSEVNSSVREERVDAILEDGTKTTITVDFEASGMSYYDKAMTVRERNSQWREWGPGLYYIAETNREGVYTVQRMTPAEIAAEGYMAGYVSTANYTAGDKWVETWAMSTTNTQITQADSESNIIGYSQEWKDLTDAKIYKLSFNKDYIGSVSDPYNVSEGDIRGFLNENVNVNNEFATDHFEGDGHIICNSLSADWNGYKKWDWNRVLIHYDGNGAKYVVSFDGVKNNRDNNSLAWDLWNNCLPNEIVWQNPASRDEAVRYAKFMLSDNLAKYGKNSFNVEENVKAAMANALYTKFARDYKDIEVANLIAELVKSALDNYDIDKTKTAAEKLNWVTNTAKVMEALKYAKGVDGVDMSVITAIETAIGQAIDATKPGDDTKTPDEKADEAIKNATNVLNSTTLTVDGAKEALKALNEVSKTGMSESKIKELEEKIAELTKKIEQLEAEAKGDVLVSFEAENAVVKVDGKETTKETRTKGGKIEFTVEPAETYKIDSVKVGEKVLTDTNGVYSIENIEESITVTVTASKIVENVTLTFKGIDKANITDIKAGEEAFELDENGSCSVAKGSTVTFKVAAKEATDEVKSVKAGTSDVPVENGVYSWKVDAATEITVTVGAKNNNDNKTPVAEGTEVNVTIKYVNDFITPKKFSAKTKTGNMIPLAEVDIRPSNVWNFNILKVSVNGEEISKTDGKWNVSVYEEDEGKVEILVDYDTGFSSGNQTARRARIAGIVGAEYVAKGNVRKGYELKKTNVKSGRTPEDFEVVDVVPGDTSEYTGETEYTVVVKALDGFDTQYSVIEAKVTLLGAIEDADPVEDLVTFEGFTASKPTVVEEDGKEVTKTEYTLDDEDGALTIVKSSTEETNEAGESVIETTFAVEASAESVAVSEDAIVTNEKVLAEAQEKGLGEDEEVVSVRSFNVTGPEGQEPKVELTGADADKYIVVAVKAEEKTRAAGDTTKWVIHILLKVTVEDKANGSVSGVKVSFNVSFEQEKAPVSYELKVEPVDALEKIDFDSAKKDDRYVNDLQENIKVVNVGDGQTFRVEGTSKAVEGWTEWGDTAGTWSYFIALKLSCEDANKNIQFKSVDAKGPSQGWKQLGKGEGTLVWKTSYESDGSIKPITVRIEGIEKEFTIDLNGLDIGDKTKKIEVTSYTGSLGDSFKLGEKSMTGADLAKVTVDAENLSVTGEAVYLRGDSFGGFDLSRSRHFVVLKLAYPDNPDASILIKSIDGTLKADGTTGNTAAEKQYKEVYKKGDQNEDGIVIWQITDDSETKERKNLIVRVEGREFTVDLSGITRAEENTGSLVINKISAVKGTDRVLGKLTSDVQIGVEIEKTGSTTFAVTKGTLKFINYGTEWSSKTDEQRGYYINLQIDEISGINSWKKLSLSKDGSSYTPFLPASASTEDEDKAQNEVMSVRISDPADPGKIYLKMEGENSESAVFTIDLSGLSFEDDLSITEINTGKIGGDGNWKDIDVSKVQRDVKVTRRPGTDIFDVEGELFYWNPMADFESGTESGYYILLNYSSKESADSGIKMGEVGPASKGFNNDSVLFHVKTTATKKVKDVVVKACDKEFTLNMEKVKINDAPTLKATTEFSGTGITESKYLEKKVADLQKDIKVEVDAENLLIRVSGSAYLLDPWTKFSNDSNVNSGWFVALDWSNNGGEFVISGEVVDRTFGSKQVVAQAESATQDKNGTFVWRIATKDKGYLETKLIGMDGQVWTIDWTGVSRLDTDQKTPWSGSASVASISEVEFESGSEVFDAVPQTVGENFDEY